MIWAWFLGGLSVGLLNAWAMSAAVRRLDPAASAHSVYWIVGGMAARWVLIAALLVLALQQGIVPVLLALGGLWIARWAALGWWSYGRAG